MGQHHCIDVARRHVQALPVEFTQVLQSPEQATIDQDACVATGEQVLGAGNGARDPPRLVNESMEFFAVGMIWIRFQMSPWHRLNAEGTDWSAAPSTAARWLFQPRYLRCGINGIHPGAAVGDQHAGDIERAAAVDVAERPCLGGARYRSGGTPSIGSGRYGSSAARRAVAGKEALQVGIAEHETGLDLVARHAQPAGFDHQVTHDPQAVEGQARMGLEGFFELVGADGHELYLRGGRVAGHMGRPARAAIGPLRP